MIHFTTKLSIIASGIMTVAAFILLVPSNTSALMVSNATFNAFCNDWPAGVYDFMYVKGQSGGVVTITVTDPAATTVDITVAMEVNYCVDWGNQAKYTSTGVKAYHEDKRVKTEDMVLEDTSGLDRLWGLSSTPQHSYISYNGNTRRSVTDEYAATLNIAGLGEGTHKFSSNFTTNIYNNTIAYSPIIEPSEDYEFDVKIVYDFAWSTTATTNMELKRVGDASFSSASDGTIVYPGDVLRWSSDVTINNIFLGGPTIDTSQRRYGASSATRNGTLTFTSSPNTRTADANAQYIVVSGDAGDDICEFLRWSPVSSSDSNSDDSDAVCAKVGYLPDLEPQPPVVPQDTALPDTTLDNISASVDNNGSTQSEPNVTAAVVRFVVKSNFAAPADAPGDVELTDNSNYRCDIAEEITSDQTDCQPIGPPYVGTFPTGLTQITSGQADNLSSIGSLTFGDRVCYVTVVNKYEKDKDAYDWRYSRPTCVVIKKTPTVHVWGNDVRVGSALNLADNQNSKIHTRVLGASPSYGSWSEYGAIAPGEITDFASGSGLYVGGAGSASSNQSAWSKLTFANTPSYGGFVSDAKDIGELPHIGDWDFNNVDMLINEPVEYRANFGNGWPNPHSNNRVVVIKAPTVKIMKNIERPTGYSDVEDMPQMIIIADDILIKKSVTQIDAWLIADGIINTCGMDGGDVLVSIPNTQQCDDDSLSINGPVVAKKLRLFRTYGAGSEAELNIPAETINFSADSYVWARHQAEQSGGLRTVAIRELPPRF